MKYVAALSQGAKVEFTVPAYPNQTFTGMVARVAHSVDLKTRTMAVELGGKKGGTAAAIMNTGGNGIGLLAPVITPYVGERLGWGWGIAIGAAVGLLGAACWFGIRPACAQGVK